MQRIWLTMRGGGEENDKVFDLICPTGSHTIKTIA